jgi:hypothetical protein
MVDFGPRLTGSESHDNYIAWLEQEFEAAGFGLEPCDTYQTDRWSAQQVGLTVSGAGPLNVAAYYPRSQGTPASGITGPLVYGGTAPSLSLSSTDLASLADALAAYPAELASWASGISGTLGGGAQGSVLVVDLPMPVPLTAAAFLPIATYLNWPGHTEADWATSDYKRLWIEPGLGIPLAPFQSMGASAVVFVVDASYAALAGGYLPFEGGVEAIPAVYVDRDTGERLRALAASRPTARLALTQDRRTVPVRAVTAVLPGASKETLIFNTHTDGQGFAEENGGVAFVQLARYFGSLSAAKRLKRTIVFAAWPGHMTYDLPQTQGWIDAHPDLVSRAAAALTVEHLGCTEWLDTLDRGYHPTGEAELFGIWTTQGTMFDLVKATVIKHDIPRAAMLRPPVQFGVGGPFQSAGVPQIGAIAGPEYLVTISPNGDLDKLDEHLAARQIAWLADLATQLDSVPAAQLRQGDPTLGGPDPIAVVAPSPSKPSKPEVCGPAEPSSPPAGAGRVTAKVGSARPRGVRVELRTTRGTLDEVEVELVRGGRVVARRRLNRVSTASRTLVLQRRGDRPFAPGTYELVVREGSRTRLRRAVRVRT